MTLTILGALSDDSGLDYPIDLPVGSVAIGNRIGIDDKDGNTLWVVIIQIDTFTIKESGKLISNGIHVFARPDETEDKVSSQQWQQLDEFLRK